MLIVVGSNIMPDNVVANQGKQPEPEIWMATGLKKHSIAQ
jgi:hypothetical protein